MTAKRRSKFFWFEGVTEAEVVRSLNDTQPSRLRQQGPRRVLVWANALVLLVMPLIALVAQPKLQSYLEVALLAVTLGLYLMLRKAVRHISDAPNELLDERQIAARDAAYTVAYRTLAFVGVAAFFLHILLPFGGGTDDLFAGRGSLILAFVMAAAALPAMVLAWNLPSEQPEA
jgi:hypothetical protein